MTAMIKCRGILIPQYKTVTHKGWKYDQTEQDDLYYVEMVNTEIEPICADCKRIICKEDYDPRKEETYLQRT